MKNKVIIICAGGHARVLLEALRLSNDFEVIAFTDLNYKSMNPISGIPIIGDDEVLTQYDVATVCLVNGLGSVADQSRRRALFDAFVSRGYRFSAVRHPSAVVASSVEVGEGSQIMAGVVLQPGVRVGRNSIVNTSASVDHDCSIGAHVHVAPGVTMSGNVTVGDSVHIGTGATIIHGVNIGGDSVIGAGAVVIDDVMPGTTVIGVPAKVR